MNAADRWTCTPGYFTIGFLRLRPKLASVGSQSEIQMIPDPNETKEDDGFQLDVGPLPPRNVKQKQKRKKPGWVAWVAACAVLGIVGTLAGLGWWLLPRESDSLTILPISEQVIEQGDVLRMQIQVQHVGREPGQLTYSLRGAPADATIARDWGVLLAHGRDAQAGHVPDDRQSGCCRAAAA